MAKQTNQMSTPIHLPHSSLLTLHTMVQQTALSSTKTKMATPSHLDPPWKDLKFPIEFKPMARKWSTSLTCISSHQFMRARNCQKWYLGSQSRRSEYIRINRKHLSEAIINRYNPYPFLSHDSVLFRVDGNIYGHPAAGLIAKIGLTVILKDGEYFVHPFVPCLFQHATNGVSFTLIVDVSC